MPTIKTTRRHQRAVTPLTRPNVVLIVTDDQEVGTLGSDVMPYLAGNPNGSWVEFPRAVVTTPLCGISRATLFSGQRWQRHGVVSNNHTQLLDESATLAVRLQAAGYRTGLFGKYNNQFPYTLPDYIPTGWDSFWGERGDESTYYSWSYLTNVPGAQTTGGTSDSDFVIDKLAGYADTFIRAADSRPWFAMLTPIAPHQDAMWPSRHAGLTWSLSDPPDWDQADLTGYPAHMSAQSYPMTTNEASRTRARRVWARRSLRSVDEMIQTVITALTQTGQLDNTVIIYQTDNSNAYGRKRSDVDDANYQKRVPYHYSVTSHLKIRYPGSPQRTDQALVGSVDIPTSILSWAGGTWTHPVDGSTKLANWCLNLGGNRPSVEVTYPKNPSSSPIPAWNMVLTNAGQKWVEYTATGERERFDTVADPYEMAPLAGTDTTLEASLSSTLAQHMSNPLFWEG